ncbi:MAG: hypothetical protein ACN6OP_09925 [Pseudomonadales bacterium]|uniref:hypothetical protein n=1 Tax=Cupriavidus sp. TaxID=1873897 RepID=UPI003D137DEF
MPWFVVLAGAHWRQLSPTIFKTHARVDDWSQLFCDGVDTTGRMVELRHKESIILVPTSAVLVAVRLGDDRAGMGFVADTDGGDTGDH